MSSFIRENRPIHKSGRTYYQTTLELRWREGARMRSKSITLKRKRKRGGGGFPPLNPLNAVMAVAALTLHLAKYGLKGRQYTDKPEEPALRGRVIAEAKMRELARLYGVNMSSREAFAKTRHLITPEFIQVRSAVVREYREQLRAAREAKMTPAQREARDHQQRELAQSEERARAAVEEFKVRMAARTQPAVEQPTAAQKAEARHLELREKNQSQQANYNAVIAAHFERVDQGNAQYAREQGWVSAQDEPATPSDEARGLAG